MTPTLQQFRAAKERYPNVLLLFKTGDFYQTFDADAQTAGRVLGLAPTVSDGIDAMLGFPHSRLQEYLAKLIRAGHRVAICEPVEEVVVKKTKVTRVVMS